jgi:hypothetical protein
MILSGFENHAGRTRLGDGAEPLAEMRRGIGNGDGHFEGARLDRVFGTYLHGPVLARNPAFADLLLELALGAPLSPLNDPAEDALREERLASSSKSARNLAFVKRSLRK